MLGISNIKYVVYGFSSHWKACCDDVLLLIAVGVAVNLTYISHYLCEGHSYDWSLLQL
jgi:hypothetical protein